MYYDVLPKIKNAIGARKEKITFPFSKMDFAVLKVLADAGYLKSVERETAGKKYLITAKIVYKGKKGMMEDFKLLSKPSRHFYADYRSLRPVKQGHGVGILSTSKGICTTKDARKNKVGGEYLFEVW
jgi:small subunit ribosomal protein S8